MKWKTISSALILGIAVSGGLACSDSPAGPRYEPDLPATFVASVTNPFFPLVPGTVHSYQGETDEGTETITVEVLSTTRTVMGVVATVVHDRVYLEGSLIEDTFDWYAQDMDGNVWYLGEDSREMENGQVVSTDGSWEWGVDEALPGVIMWGDPGAHLGEEYRQEYYKGEAEDWGKVVAMDVTVTVPYGTLTGCLKTEEWNALEKNTLEAKWYCPQVGFVKEMKLQGGSEVVELITVTAG